MSTQYYFTKEQFFNKHGPDEASIGLDAEELIARAIEKGFITPEQLIDALNIQITGEIIDGKHRLIGQILLKMNHMTLEQIEEVLADLITE